MSEKEYLNADYEVIGMVNRGRGPGGQLPAKVVHFVPEERADLVLALDERIQKIQKALLVMMLAAIILFTFLAGRAL